jgi:enamine deaminase RidA (YjgF/YER057c/UK114 family)
MKRETILPEGWKAPSGYSNGVLVEGGGRQLFVAGQVSWDANAELVGPGDFVAQFRQAVANVVTVVRAAGGEPEHVAEVTVFVTDKAAYVDHLKAVGAAWRDVMGRHYPAMALVVVKDLLEEGALVEVQARAVLPPARSG